MASVRPSQQSPRRVATDFRRLLGDGVPLRCAGSAQRDPAALVRRYAPRHRIALFDNVFYLSDARQNPDLRFFVTYVVPPGRTAIFPRLFYKDVSLVWRSASHYIPAGDGIWIGKGEVRSFEEDGEELLASVESTTDLPLEMQTALETALQRTARIVGDTRAVDRVLRRGPAGRIEPYRDFVAPRRRARENPRNLVNRGRPVARFTRRGDPSSLRFVAGFEPDFRHGIVERSASRSRLYGGRVRRYRVVSVNRSAQYLFFAGRRYVWLAPPQATTVELSSFGVRTVDVEAPEDLSIPGYEYHFIDASEDPPRLFSQIPEGYAGDLSPEDESRADASAWLEKLPVVREFRRRVLGRAR